MNAYKTYSNLIGGMNESRDKKVPKSNRQTVKNVFDERLE